MLRYEVYVYRRDYAGKTQTLQSDRVVTHEEGDDIPALLLLDEFQYKALIDAVHELNVHPEKHYVEGKLEATESHLADMRALLKLK